MNFYIIKTEFEKNQNKQHAKKMAAYMRNKFDFYGIMAADRKAIYKDDLKDAIKSKTIDWDFLNKCWDDNHREFQYVNMDYLNAMQNYLTCDDMPKMQKFIKEKQWWDTIDYLSKVIGFICHNCGNCEIMIDWSTNDDFWIRRVAILHQLGFKDKTNTELLSKILINNFGSDEFFINKAIGWSLREYSKTNPQWVKSFIDKHYNKMDRLSIREGSKYI